MTGEEHGKKHSRRWFDMVDRLSQEKRERFLDPGPAVPCLHGIPGGCYHLSCKIDVGALPKIAEFNAWFRDEAHNNWLRFLGTGTLAKLYWSFKAHYRRTGKLPIIAAVYAGILRAHE